VTSRPRGYAEWRPHRKTEALLEQVDEVLAVYRAEWPLTVRQIFYRLVGRYEYPKDEHGYSRLGECLNRARRARRIPFSAIRDDGVVVTQFEWFDGPEGFWDDAARRARTYRRDRQASQSQRIELWCEAAGMMPQLARIADEFSVPVRSASGFSSVTGNHDLAARVIGYSVPTVILHVGDFDPSGVSIFTAMVEDAAAFVEADRDRTLGDYENVSLRGCGLRSQPIRSRHTSCRRRRRRRATADRTGGWRRAKWRRSRPMTSPPSSDRRSRPRSTSRAGNRRSTKSTTTASKCSAHSRAGPAHERFEQFHGRP
jgi:hypothetical protein